MPAKRDKLDQTISIRLDLSTLHAVERFAAKWNQARLDILAAVEAGHTGRLPPLYKNVDELRKAPNFSASDVIRRALKMAIPFWDGDEAEMMDWCEPMIERDVKRILAATIVDRSAGDSLRQMVAYLEREGEPNFG